MTEATSEIKLEVLGQPSGLSGEPRPEIVGRGDPGEGRVDQVGIVADAGLAPRRLDQSGIDAGAQASGADAGELAAVGENLEREPQAGGDDRIDRPFRRSALGRAARWLLR